MIEIRKKTPFYATAGHEINNRLVHASGIQDLSSYNTNNKPSSAFVLGKKEALERSKRCSDMDLLLQQMQLALRIHLHLVEFLLFNIAQLMVQVLEIWFRRDVLEEIDEVALRIVVPVAGVPAGFVHVGH